MEKVLNLPQPQARDTEPRPQEAPQPEGQLVALPFIELKTVVKTMAMLRRYPDQRVLDNFNRRGAGGS